MTWKQLKKLLEVIPESELDTPACFSLDGSDENTWDINSIWDFVPGETGKIEDSTRVNYLSSM